MIKFFRKIRQKLLSENKFSKYLIYAIGEIVLVVLGILIALQINNWNQEKQDRILESKYLENLVEEADVNILSLNQQTEFGKRKLEAINFIIKNLDKKPKDINLDSLNLALGKTLFLSQFVVLNTTFYELKSSGKLSLIRSDLLRKELIEYYQGIEVVYTVIDVGINNHWKYNYSPFMDKHFNTFQSTANWAESIKEYYGTPEIEFNLVERIITESNFWSLEKEDALKLEFNNILTNLYSGEWFLNQTRIHLIGRTKKIKERLEEQLKSK